MLDRVRMRTKFVTLLVLALAALAAVGVPSLRDHENQQDAAQRGRDRVRIAGTLGEFLDQLGREATLTAWFSASGERAARAALAAARPMTDRTARSVISHVSSDSLPRSVELALRSVSAQWKSLRTSRARFDRRLASDDHVLVRFDQWSSQVVGALRAVAAEPSGIVATDATHDPTSALHARADLADLERNAAASQAAVLTALLRHQVSPTLAARLGVIAARHVAASVTVRATQTTSPGSEARWRQLQPLARTTAAYRRPAILGRVPFVTASEWRRVSGLEIHAIGRLGRVADHAGSASAAGAAERARSSSIGTGLVLAFAGLILILGVFLAARSRRPAIGVPTEMTPGIQKLDAVPPSNAIISAHTTTSSLAQPTRARSDAPAAPIVIAHDVTQAPILPRRTRESQSPEPGVPLALPSRRTPGAAFELVARFEAGVRRAREPEERQNEPGDSPE